MGVFILYLVVFVFGSLFELYRDRIFVFRFVVRCFKVVRTWLGGWRVSNVWWGSGGVRVGWRLGCKLGFYGDGGGIKSSVLVF